MTTVSSGEILGLGSLRKEQVSSPSDISALRPRSPSSAIHPDGTSYLLEANEGVSRAGCLRAAVLRVRHRARSLRNCRERSTNAVAQPKHRVT